MPDRVFDVAGVLLQTEWEEGKIFPIIRVPYRYRIMGVCTSAGHEIAQFANGMFPYFEHMQMTRPDGSWGARGNVIVPVLPDSRLIMVVEQRPPQYRFANQPTHIEIDGVGRVALAEFGPYSSLEFPGGGIDEGENYTAGFLRELGEETGVADQETTLYWCARPHYTKGSDVADEHHLGVIYLSEMKFEGYVKTDGGLHVLALTRGEVQRNIWNGVICSGSAALLAWAFYGEIADADFHALCEMERAGYLEIKKVQVKR